MSALAAAVAVLSTWRLRLFTSGGGLVETNTYWLSTRPDVPDFSIRRWWYMPTKRFPDLRSLSKLPPLQVQVEGCVAGTPDGSTAGPLTLHVPEWNLPARTLSLESCA